MRRHRLDRLQKLAQGAAVISMGVIGAGCQDKAGAPPEEPIHANATATPTPTPDMTPSMNATAAPMPSASTTPAPHTINAPPQAQPAPKTSK